MLKYTEQLHIRVVGLDCQIMKFAVPKSIEQLHTRLVGRDYRITKFAAMKFIGRSRIQTADEVCRIMRLEAMRFIELYLIRLGGPGYLIMKSGDVIAVVAVTAAQQRHAADAQIAFFSSNLVPSTWMLSARRS